MQKQSLLIAALALPALAAVIWCLGESSPESGNDPQAPAASEAQTLPASMRPHFDRADEILDELQRFEVTVPGIATASEASWGDIEKVRLTPARVANQLDDNPQALLRWKGVNPDDTPFSPEQIQAYTDIQKRLRNRIERLRSVEAEVAQEELALLRQYRPNDFKPSPDQERTMILDTEASRQPDAKWRLFVGPDGARHRVCVEDLPNTLAAQQMADFARQEARIRTLDFFANVGTMPNENRQLIEEFLFTEGAYERLHKLRITDKERYLAIMRVLF